MASHQSGGFGTQPAFAQGNGEKPVFKCQRHLLFAEIALRAYQHKNVGTWPVALLQDALLCGFPTIGNNFLPLER